MRKPKTVKQKKFQDFRLEFRHVKSLEVITFVLTLRKKLDKQKIKDFFWKKRRAEFVGQTDILKSGEREVNPESHHQKPAYLEQKSLEPVNSRNT